MISLKILTSYFYGTIKLNLKLTWKTKDSEGAKTILKKYKEAEVVLLNSK